jgi:hypothetical protein
MEAQMFIVGFILGIFAMYFIVYVNKKETPSEYQLVELDGVGFWRFDCGNPFESWFVKTINIDGNYVQYVFWDEKDVKWSKISSESISDFKHMYKPLTTEQIKQQIWKDRIV